MDVRFCCQETDYKGYYGRKETFNSRRTHLAYRLDSFVFAFRMRTWLYNNQEQKIHSLVYQSIDQVWEIYKYWEIRKYKRNHFSDPIGEEFLNEYGFTEIEADFSAKTMTLCKIKLLSKSFRSYLIDKIAKKCANRYRNAHQKLHFQII